MTEKEIFLRSKKVCENFTSLSAYSDSNNIAVYYPVNNEVDSTFFIDQIISSGKNCFLPKVVDNELYFYHISNIQELVRGPFGIPEPSGSAVKAHINDIDLFIVPGLCFGLNGARLGYGKGFYDRALKDVSSFKIYAFCYSFQILNEVPTGNFDKPVGHIVSESGIVSI